MNKGIYWKCIYCGYAHADDICPNCSRDGIAAFDFPPPRTWVGLTDEEILRELERVDPHAKRLPTGLKIFAHYLEAKLKEKNT